MKSGKRVLYSASFAAVALILLAAWTPVPVKDDPLVRMPGTQPGQASIEGPGRCLNCHGDYDHAVEPGHNWKGSMMAQSSRDFLFWSCLTSSAQDSIHAIDRPNATDICLRCHLGKGWLEGRSDPTNGSAMTGDDFDGVQCDQCHQMWNPHFEDTHSAGGRLDEVLDWDEATTLSETEAGLTYTEDELLSQAITYLNGELFFVNRQPGAEGTYDEAGTGQYYISPGGEKRASYADAEARHRVFYSRFHKSRFFCGTCHDIHNPVLGNLAGADENGHLPSETQPAYAQVHVERTFSEFRLSVYGRGDNGDAGIGPFAPDQFETSNPDNYINKCQDCHMRDVVGRGCNKKGAPIRPTESTEHPKSGLPLHDLTGGNAWVSWVLASSVPGSPNFVQANHDLLYQGPGVLTLDMSQGQGLDAQAILDGSTRAKEQLNLAAAFPESAISLGGGTLSFRIQNQTGHKLISGFPEGRRMFVNIKLYDADGGLIQEVNPYDFNAGTLKGLYPAGEDHYSDPDPEPLPDPLGLEQWEVYNGDLVYEMHAGSTITQQKKTFHFALANYRSKDNRIPPKGFDNSKAADRMVDSRCNYVANDLDVTTDDTWEDCFTSAEYLGGYDDVSISVPLEAASAEINLYYQTTSREYIEFLRDQINGNASTLPADAYIVQTDPWFSQLKAWGDTVWALWKGNKDVDGARPYLMVQASVGGPPPPGGGDCPALPTPTGLTAAPDNRKVILNWDDMHTGDANVLGYRIYYDQAGKSSFLDQVGHVTTYTDTGLSNGIKYCYKITTYNDAGTELCESAMSDLACATPAKGGGGKPPRN